MRRGRTAFDERYASGTSSSFSRRNLSRAARAVHCPKNVGVCRRAARAAQQAGSRRQPGTCVGRRRDRGLRRAAVRVEGPEVNARAAARACPARHDAAAVTVVGAACPARRVAWAVALRDADRTGAAAASADRREGDLRGEGPLDVDRDPKVAWGRDLRSGHPAGCRRGYSRTGLQWLRQAHPYADRFAQRSDCVTHSLFDGSVGGIPSATASAAWEQGLHPSRTTGPDGSSCRIDTPRRHAPRTLPASQRAGPIRPTCGQSPTTDPVSPRRPTTHA